MEFYYFHTLFSIFSSKQNCIDTEGTTYLKKSNLSNYTPSDLKNMTY